MNEIIQGLSGLSLGSRIARGGYKEELVVCDILNKDPSILNTHGTVFSKLQGANKKTDITNGVMNVQVKKSRPKQFGQVARHSLSRFLEHIPELADISDTLNILCVKSNGKRKKLSDLPTCELERMLSMLEIYKKYIIQLVVLGKEIMFIPEFMCDVCYSSNHKTFRVYNMKDICDELESHNWILRKSGTVVGLGPLTFQRKGGDSGRDTANHIQFKIVMSDICCVPVFEKTL